MSWNVNIRRIRQDGGADCATCHGVDLSATRERCRQHADQHPGHEVRFVVEEITTYTRGDGNDEHR